MTAPLLEVAGLEASYGRARILFGIDLRVAAGEAAVLVGRNGAGKSTTLKAIMGLVPPRARALTFAGHDLRGLQPYRIARLGIGYVPEDRRVFAELTTLENLAVGRHPPRAGAPTWTPDDLFTLFPSLAELRHRPGGLMSGGEQQMLTIARTLMGNPRLLLLDEPSEGLAPLVVEQLAAALHRLKSAGLTILLAEQNVRFAAALADRAIVIEKGMRALDRPHGRAGGGPATSRGAFGAVMRRPRRREAPPALPPKRTWTCLQSSDQGLSGMATCCASECLSG